MTDDPNRLPAMFATVGTANSAGVVVALIVGVSVIPIIFLHFKGEHWRNRKGEAVVART